MIKIIGNLTTDTITVSSNDNFSSIHKMNAINNIHNDNVDLYLNDELVGFDSTILAPLFSSLLSVILATLSALLEFPKHYYIYQIGTQLKVSHNPKLRESLKMTST